MISSLSEYEAAKSKFRDNGSLHSERLKKALLEYRRQHNIFEVGDYVVVDSYKPEFQFFQLTQDDMGSHWVNLVEFRHATDAEIKAGRRLEVNQ